MPKTICVKEIATAQIVHKVDVSNKPERAIERIIRGIEINLNHKEYVVVKLMEE